MGSKDNKTFLLTYFHSTWKAIETAKSKKKKQKTEQNKPQVGNWKVIPFNLVYKRATI